MYPGAGRSLPKLQFVGQRRRPLPHADRKNYFIPFVLVTSLFLLWGVCNGMIDILNKHFQDSLHINKMQSASCSSPIIWDIPDPFGEPSDVFCRWRIRKAAR